MLPPHYHPRATNFVAAVEGQTQTWMIQENGADLATTTLKPGQLTIFPRGSLHPT
ncbi:spherulin-1A [Colletotrichum abscissum]|uniref:Spherulin-1A n=1 Tax=Colletotrichum abscissum TaxID=1671311 RepID=A0A9Q0AY68_9PEZI|nr:spherulin-1A [Colletotrichum abscissum]KAI3544935.1 spherulin-1A [Colletotrichum abscissum]KAK1478214.1 spherulin-1A [Colletotrichum abscissum]